MFYSTGFQFDFWVKKLIFAFENIPALELTRMVRLNCNPLSSFLECFVSLNGHVIKKILVQTKNGHVTLFTVQMTTWQFSIILTSKRNPKSHVTVLDIKVLFEESPDTL